MNFVDPTLRLSLGPSVLRKKNVPKGSSVSFDGSDILEEEIWPAQINSWSAMVKIPKIDLNICILWRNYQIFIIGILLGSI